jgi:GNAT superfamily N-acetyltransferase
MASPFTAIEARLQWRPVQPGDFEDLLALRLRAMQPSLQALGRFDPQRARERFASGFVPQHMHRLWLNGVAVGCVTLRPEPEALVLDHLYIEPAHQGQGLGAQVLDWAKALADQRQCPLRLEVLQGSDANRFYQGHGLVEVGRSAFDIAYERAPHARPSDVVQSLWTAVQARDWRQMRALLHDDAQAAWPATGELMDADAFVAVNAEYPEGWTLHLLALQPQADGRVHSLVRVKHPPASFLADSRFSVRDGRIQRVWELWATVEAAPAWRQPARFPGLRSSAQVEGLW